MKSVFSGCLFSISKGFLKFFIAYFIFGYISLWVITISIGTMECIENGYSALFDLYKDDGNVLVFLCRMIKKTIDSVAFGELFEVLIDDGGGMLSALLNFCTSLGDINFTGVWSDYSPIFFRDIAISALASLFFFILSRLNRLFNIHKSVSFKLGYIIVSVLWTYASFCASNCIITILEHITKAEKNNTLYLTIFIVSFIVHIISLRCSENFSVLRVLIILCIDSLFGILRALSVWLLRGYLLGLYSIIDVSASIGAFITVAIILYTLELLQKSLTKVITYPIYCLYLKLGLRF